MNDPAFRMGWTKLHYACGISFEKTKEVLESKEFDINVATPNGVTPLMVATAVMVESRIIKYLIQMGADITAKTQKGQVANDFLIFK